MKCNLTILLSALGMAVALTVGSTLARAQTSAANPAPGTAEAPHHKANERHPAIRRAIFALEEAKRDLQHADHDFGGHRAEALEECEKALAQLKLALQYDKK